MSKATTINSESKGFKSSFEAGFTQTAERAKDTANKMRERGRAVLNNGTFNHIPFKNLSDTDQGWTKIHTYENGKYHLTSEDLVDSRMVIDPYHQYEANEEYDEDTELPVELSVERSAEMSEARRNRIKSKLGRCALESVNKWWNPIDKWMRYGITSVMSRMPGIMSEEDREAASKAHYEKFAANENDGMLKSLYKKARRGERGIRNWAPVVAMGGIALNRFMPGGLALVDAGYEAGHKAWNAYDGLYPDKKDNIYNADIPYRTMEVQYVARTVFTIGGASDVNGDMATDGGHRMGLYNRFDTNIKARYSASIGPFAGHERMDSSIAQVYPQMQAAYEQAQANGQPFVIYGFSEGSVAAWDSLQKMVDDGYDMRGVEFIVDGGPIGEMGLGKSNYVGAVNPFLEAMGIDITRGIPNAEGMKITVRSYSGDVWGASGDDSGLATATMIAGLNAHQQVNPNISYIVAEKTINGITYQEWAFKEGPQHPLGRLLYTQGLYVSPAFDRVLDSMVPITHLGEETQYANADEVTKAVGALIDDTIKFQTGYDSKYAQEIIEKVMNDNPQYERELQSVLQLSKTLDRVALMANDPSKIQAELPIVMDEIKAALHTTGNYLKPNTWVDVINNSAESLGLGNVIKLKHFETPEAGSYTARATSTSGNYNQAPIVPEEKAQIIHENVQQVINNFKQGVQEWVDREKEQKAAREAVNNAQQTHTESAPTTPQGNSHEAPQPTYTPSNRGNTEVHVDTGVPVTPVEANIPPAPAPAPQRPITDFLKNIGEQWQQRREERQTQRANTEVHVDTSVPVTPVEANIPPAPAPAPQRPITDFFINLRDHLREQKAEREAARAGQ